MYLEMHPFIRPTKVISHILAVLSGKCEVLEAGIQRTAYVEEISITTRKPPESAPDSRVFQG